jgi:hypothetical protein
MKETDQILVKPFSTLSKLNDLQIDLILIAKSESKSNHDVLLSLCTTLPTPSYTNSKGMIQNYKVDKECSEEYAVDATGNY